MLKWLFIWLLQLEQFARGIVDATSTNNFKHLFDHLIVIQCMFCNMVSVFVLGPGPTAIISLNYTWITIIIIIIIQPFTVARG